MYGDFVMTTHVRFMHVNEGDQAGLMVRLNSDCWLKAAVTNHPPGAPQWPSLSLPLRCSWPAHFSPQRPQALRWQSTHLKHAIFGRALT